MLSFPLARYDVDTSTYYACQEFRRLAQQVKRNDYKRIEYMLRKGEKQTKLINMPGVQTIGSPTTITNNNNNKRQETTTTTTTTTSTE